MMRRQPLAEVHAPAELLVLQDQPPCCGRPLLIGGLAEDCDPGATRTMPSRTPTVWSGTVKGKRRRRPAPWPTTRPSVPPGRSTCSICGGERPGNRRVSLDHDPRHGASAGAAQHSATTEAAHGRRAPGIAVLPRPRVDGHVEDVLVKPGRVRRVTGLARGRSVVEAPVPARLAQQVAGKQLLERRHRQPVRDCDAVSG